MSDYLFVPDDDSEYGPIWETTEARENFTADELADASPAELVVMRDGHGGHYLAACYLDDAADIVKSLTVPPTWWGLIARTQEWERDASAYNEHGGSYCPEDSPGYDADSHLCESCEWIHDTTNDAESILSDLGFVSSWNDGFTIHRVG